MNTQVLDRSLQSGSWRARHLAIALTAVTILSGCTSSTPSGFQSGRQLLVAGRFSEALPVLEGYLRSSPDGRDASRAAFFIGKAYLGLGRLDEAQNAFERTVQDYGKTLEGHKAGYKLAQVFLLKGNRSEALRRFQDMSDFPDGPLVAEATAFAAYLRGLSIRPAGN